MKNLELQKEEFIKEGKSILLSEKELLEAAEYNGCSKEDLLIFDFWQSIMMNDYSTPEELEYAHQQREMISYKIDFNFHTNRLSEVEA